MNLAILDLLMVWVLNLDFLNIVGNTDEIYFFTCDSTPIHVYFDEIGISNTE